MSLLSMPWLYRYTWAIAAITIASGAFQVAFTGWELDFLDAENKDSTRHFFAIVGMFMVLFGGLVLHALRDPSTAKTPPVVGWPPEVRCRHRCRDRGGD